MRVVFLSTLLGASAGAQIDSAAALRGVVHTADGHPVESANVFVLETLDGTLADSRGRFTIRTTYRGPATVVVRRIGFRPKQLSVTLPATAPLEITVVREAQ